MFIPISRIIVNKQKIDPEHVDDFVEILERGRKVKPITVRMANEVDERTAYDNGMCIILGVAYYVLVDGRHRLAAHKALGKEMIECIVTL